MENKKIYIRTLGGFSISYEDKSIVLERSNLTKATQLFQYLVFNRNNKIPRDTLINILYANTDIDNPANNLKVNLYRLRRILEASHLPENVNISFKSGMYTFYSPIPIEIDSEVFLEYVNQSKQDNVSTEEKLILLQRAIEVYSGEFLPMISNEPWVVLENVKLHKIYINCVDTACQILKKSGDFNLMLDICNRAVRLYPLDEEMHLLRISCLLDMKRYVDALNAYEETTRYFFEELGVSPSEKMLSLYKKMTGNIKLETSTINQIKESLSEEDSVNGAYYCNYLGFIDSYRFLSRVVERSGQSIFFSLFTIVNVQGAPLEPGEKLQASARELHEIICSSLRRGDLYTRYSTNQFLVLLVGINFENCTMVSDRIINKFKDDKKVRGVRLKHSSISGTDLHSSNTSIKFSGASRW